MLTVWQTGENFAVFEVFFFFLSVAAATAAAAMEETCKWIGFVVVDPSVWACTVYRRRIKKPAAYTSVKRRQSVNLIHPTTFLSWPWVGCIYSFMD
jgi:hypothetical protein